MLKTVNYVLVSPLVDIHPPLLPVILTTHLHISLSDCILYVCRYDWTQTPWYHNGCNSQVLANRVPMVWGWRSGTDVPLHIPNDAQYVLGFNEPNFHHQVCVTLSTPTSARLTYSCMGLNVHSNLLRLIREGGGGQWGDEYLCPATYSLHCQHQNDCTKAGSCGRHFNVSLIVRAKPQDSVHNSPDVILCG